MFQFYTMERGVFVQSRPAQSRPEGAAGLVGTASLGKHTLASPQDTIVGMVIMRRDLEVL